MSKTYEQAQAQYRQRLHRELKLQQGAMSDAQFKVARVQATERTNEALRLMTQLAPS